MNTAPTPPPAFEPCTVAHGRGAYGLTGHVWSVSAKRTLCNAEKRTPWLSVEPAGLDDPSGPDDPRTLADWLEVNGAAVCGTCLRLYRRAVPVCVATVPSAQH